MHRAFIDEYLTVDIAAKVKGIPDVKVKRETLTLEEAETLAKTPCENEVLKRAFFFAVLTGIRLCDIHDLTWGEITQTGSGWRVDFTQRKTHVVDYLPINEQAYSLCGERGEQNQRVFEGLTGSSWISRPLKKWIEASGIKKHITFHVSSHSKLFYLLNISELSILKNVTANDLETSYILFLSQLCNIQRTL